MERNNCKERYFEAFFIALFVAFVFYVPFLLYDKGYFLFYGDFNVQQVPFYPMAHDAVRKGDIFWNWNTDLGVNFMGSYAFYLLGSPFFWITMPFPSDAVPYLMGPLLMLKFACASLTGYMFIRRFAKNRDFALIGALLYAFSGFSVYNIFFNHFHEAIIMFPLLLVGLEELMQNDRKGVFAAAITLSALANYMFFAGQVIFVVIYWILRLTSGAWEITAKKFISLIVESVVGLLMSMFLLLPALIVVTTNPRTDSIMYGWGALFYGKEQRYGSIIECFFFPPDLPARPNFFPEADAKWASLGGWLPLFSMTGVIAWMQSKKNWLKKIIITLSFFALVPILNSLFFLLNEAYYARWFYMLTLMMALATVMSLERKQTDWNRAFRWTFGITAAFTVVIGFMPKERQDGEFKTFGLMEYPDRFWVYVVIAIGSLLTLSFIIKLLHKNPKKFAKLAVLSVTVITIVYSMYYIGTGKSQSYLTRDFIIPYSLRGNHDITLPEGENYRVDVYDGMDNQAMFWKLPTIQAFHSIVPRSVMDFYPQVGVERGVGSRPETKYPALRPLLSVRWLFDYAADNGFADRDDNGEILSTKMAGYEYYDTQNGFNIYENQNFIPMGFTYDKYITQADFDETSKGERSNILLKGILLDDSQIDKYGHMYERLETPQYSDMSADAMAQDCAERNDAVCYDFKRDNLGFSAKINLEEETLVFFSVPWEEGFTATVNGLNANVEKVNVGFMAVRVPAGRENVIRFNYMTPGFFAGILITLVSGALLALYLVLFRIIDKRERLRAENAGYIESVDIMEGMEDWFEGLPSMNGTGGVPGESNENQGEIE